MGSIAHRRDQKRPLSDECTDALQRLLSNSDNTMSSIVATFVAPLTIFADAIVDAATSADDFSLEDLRRKATAKAIARIDAEAERAAMVARIESSLSERYVIKRAPVTIGDMKIGSTEYRFRGDSSRVAFTESTFRLATDTNSPSVARSMVDLAQARDWKGLRISGAEDFRRMVWLEATVRGVKVLGYEPNLADLEVLKREREARQTNRIEPALEASPGNATAPSEKSSARGGGRKAMIAAIDAVLVAKKVPEAKRQAILAAAAEQLAQRSREGAAPKIKVYDRTAQRQLPIAPPPSELNRAQERSAPTRSR